MNLTPEQLKQNAAAMIAHAEGKQIEWRAATIKGTWYECKSPAWEVGSHEYRPKPEPVPRPWSKPSDVPGPVCWIRDPEQERLVITIDKIGITAGSYIFGQSRFEWSSFERGIEYSTDRKTWNPCTTEEP